MVEDPFLYSITLFTFAVIFGLCYIRHIFTFFERKLIARASTPKFPLGNVSNVLFGKYSLSMQLWKYHNRFKKKSCRFGGFFVFLKPAVVIVDQSISLTDRDYFEPLDSKPNSLNFEVESRIFELFQPADLHVKEAGDDVDVAKVLRQSVHNICQKTIFGVEDNKELESAIDQILRKPTNFQELTTLVFPRLFAESSAGVFSKIVDEAIKKRKKTDLKGTDVIQVLIDANFERDGIVDVTLNLVQILKWTRNLIMFCLFELGINKEVQVDLRGEITRFWKQNDGKGGQNLNQLSYLDTVVRETLRKYPPKPLACWKCKKDMEVAEGSTIPENVLVFVSVFGIHHDAGNYTNPELFDPDRFSEENEKFIEPRKYMPFGFQSGSDFDLRLTTHLMKMFLNEFLYIFKCSLGKKSHKQLSFEENTSDLRPKDGMWLNLELL